MTELDLAGIRQRYDVAELAERSCQLAARACPDSSAGPHAQRQPSASYSITIRVELSKRPGALGRVTTAIGATGGDIDAVDIVQVSGSTVLRDITVAANGQDHARAIARQVAWSAGAIRD